METQQNITPSQQSFIMDIELIMQEINARHITIAEGYDRLLHAFREHQQEQ